MHTDVLLMQHMEPVKNRYNTTNSLFSLNLWSEIMLKGSKVKSGQSPWLFGGRQEGGSNMCSCEMLKAVRSQWGLCRPLTIKLPRLSVLQDSSAGIYLHKGFDSHHKNFSSFFSQFTPGTVFFQRLKLLLVPCMSVIAFFADNECYED